MCGALSGVQGSWVGERACSGGATCRATYLLGAASMPPPLLPKKSVGLKLKAELVYLGFYQRLLRLARPAFEQ